MGGLQDNADTQEHGLNVTEDDATTQIPTQSRHAFMWPSLSKHRLSMPRKLRYRACERMSHWDNHRLSGSMEQDAIGAPPARGDPSCNQAAVWVCAHLRGQGRVFAAQALASKLRAVVDSMMLVEAP
ncbi:hypothetical protein PybrP1_006961 [[Pythium] brassicae (nom. inval.)]|nr:hypothetical protein PybrP1_006961 [[Pythium] brassicae (nom. inval.)]